MDGSRCLQRENATRLRDVLGSAAPDKAMAGHRTPKFLGEALKHTRVLKV